METSNKFDNLLEEIKSVVLSVPCPYCGGVQQEPINPGEEVKCIYCRRYYSVKGSMTGISNQAIKNLVDDVLAKHDLALEKASKDLMERYTERVFEDLKNYYVAFERIPLREELDEKLSDFTDTIHRDYEVIIVGQKRIEQKEDMLLKHDEEQNIILNILDVIIG